MTYKWWWYKVGDGNDYDDGHGDGGNGKVHLTKKIEKFFCLVIEILTLITIHIFIN